MTPFLVELSNTFLVKNLGYKIKRLRCNCLDMNNYFEFSHFLETFIRSETWAC